MPPALPPTMGAPALPVPAARPMSTSEYAGFVALLSRVGCHVYTGEVLTDGSYRELYTGPGIELFIGGALAPGADRTDAWNTAVHPDDRDAYLDAATVDSDSMISLEYRMIGRDGRTRWVLDQMWLREATSDGRRIIDGVVTDITGRKNAELGLRRLAHSDPLTGLANRLDLTDHIDAAVGALGPASPGVALLLLDLDGFKAVNDSFGHAVGDELLARVARRLRESLRPGDTAARLGGDEFAVLVEQVDGNQALAAAQRVLAAVGTAFELSRTTVAISASVGLVHATDARGSQDLMRDADVAMYRAKAEGKNRIVSFEPAMQALVSRRLALETELRRGVEEGEFRLHYQPVVDLATREIVGVEALIRWQHPTRGLLPPGEFIDIVEDTGLIVPLGRWVIERAVHDAAGWCGPDGAQLSVSVNLSPRQFHDVDLISTIDGALASTGLAAGSLVVEITENLLLNDAALASARLTDLRRRGVRVAVDDFGTGYSSLAYLDRYPVDVLKIDRSFVGSLGRSGKSTALVRAIVDLGGALGLQTVAEGVEEERQASLLTTLGCDLAQGYLYSAPVPAGELAELVSEASDPERTRALATRRAPAQGYGAVVRRLPSSR